MPVDSASATVVVAAPLEKVLAAVRDVASQTDWVKEITEAELLEAYEDGTPSSARFAMTTAMGADEYTLHYEHGDDVMSWTMTQGKMQQAQTGSYRLRALGPDSTEVTLSLEVEHSIGAPGFLRKMVFKGIVDGNLASLQKYVEA
jgi:hypothetical protein